MKRLIAAVIYVLLWPSLSHAVTLVGSSTCTIINGTAQNCSLSLQVGTTNGMTMVACEIYGGAVPTDSTGMTPLGHTTAGSSPNIICDTKTASSETGPYVYTNTGSGIYATGILTVWTNTAGIDGTPQLGGGLTCTSGTFSNPNYTTTVANDLGVIFTGAQGASVTGIASVASPYAIVVSQGGASGPFDVATATISGTGSQTGPITTITGTCGFGAGISFGLKPFACAANTANTICPQGAGASGDCEFGPTTVQQLLSCFVCPASTNCTAFVTDANASCSAGTSTVPTGGGTNGCAVNWNGSQWVE